MSVTKKTPKTALSSHCQPVIYYSKLLIANIWMPS